MVHHGELGLGTHSPRFGVAPRVRVRDSQSTLWCGPWEHVPAHVWTAPTQEDNDDEDVVGDDGDVCALCCTKFDPEKMSMCDKCELQYCTVESPNSKGVSKGCAWGLFRGNIV